MNVRRRIGQLILPVMATGLLLAPWQTALADTAAEDAAQPPGSEALDVPTAPPLLGYDKPTQPARGVAAPELSWQIAKPGSPQSPADSLRGYVRKVKLSTCLKEINRSASRLQRKSLDMIGELERFNLLWGRPPADYNPEMLWGGGFTEEQVLEEFLRMPTTVFTTPSYVMLFSYRLPPRKKFLVYHTREMGKLINSMWRDVSEADVPPDKWAAIQEPWTDLLWLMKYVQVNYMAVYRILEDIPPGTLKGSISEHQRRFGRPLVAMFDSVYGLKLAVNRIRKAAGD